MKVVFDTNVFISAIITEGLCSRLLRRARLREFSLIICPCIIDEVERILKEKFKAPREEISSALELINEAVNKVVKVEIPIPLLCKDKNDDMIIGCALAAKADYLVTGDSELIGIHQYKNIKIISPREFEMLFE